MKQMAYSLGVAIIAALMLSMSVTGQQPANPQDKNTEKQSDKSNDKQAKDRSSDDRQSNDKREDKNSGNQTSRDEDRQDARDDRNTDDRDRSAKERDGQHARESDRSNGTSGDNYSEYRNSSPSSKDQWDQKHKSDQSTTGRDDQGRANDRSGSRQDGSTNGNRGASRGADLRGPDIGLWFDRSSRDELIISDVSSHGPIVKIGFHEGDRIVSIDGRRVRSEADFITYLTADDAPQQVKVIIIRDGREQTLLVEPAILVEDDSRAQVDPLEQFGIILDDRYNDRLIVWKVIPRSPAYYAGFRPGDELSTMRGHNYSNRTEFEKGVADLQPGEVPVEVQRGERTRQLYVDVPDYNRNATRNDVRVEQRNKDRERSSDQRVGDRRNDQRQDNRSTSDSNNRRPIFRGR